MNLIVAVALAVSFCHGSLASGLFQSCNTQDSCGDVHTECRILSPTCGGGTCVCQPGFLEYLNGTQYTCRRAVGLGAYCNIQTDTCTTPNADCINAKCDCRSGYTHVGGSCSVGTQPIGGKCQYDLDCYEFGNMACISNYCQCKVGYRVYDKYRCARRNVGDACSSDRDCAAMPHTHCSPFGICDCTSDAHRALVNLPMPVSLFAPLYDNVMQGYACFSNDGPGNEGAACYSGEDYLMLSDAVAAPPPAPSTTTTTVVMGPAPAPPPPAPAVYSEGGRAADPADIFFDEGAPATDAPTTTTTTTTVPPTTLPPVSYDKLKLCAAPFQCTYCTLDKPVCARMVPLYSSARTLIAGANILLLAALALIH